MALEYLLGAIQHEPARHTNSTQAAANGAQQYAAPVHQVQAVAAEVPSATVVTASHAEAEEPAHVFSWVV